MVRSRRRLLILGAVLFGAVLLAVAVLWSPPFQRWAWQRVAAAIAEKTGWRISAEEVRLRPWPARLEARGLEVAALAEPLATVERLEVRWRWSALLTAPRRVDLLGVDGLTLDLRQLPPRAQPAEQAPAADPWRVVEIGELRLRQGVVRGAAAGLEVAAQELAVTGGLEQGRARVTLGAEELRLRRDGRELALGKLHLAGTASAGEVTLESLGLAGEPVRLELSGGAGGSLPALKADARLQLEAEVEPLLTWWDPQLAAKLAPRGKLILSGRVGRESGGKLLLDLHHRGGDLTMAGYALETIDVDSPDGKARVRIADPAWGAAVVALTEPLGVSLEADLAGAPLNPLLALASTPLPVEVPGELRASGRLSAATALPPSLDTVSGSADLRLAGPDVAVTLVGSAEGHNVTLERLTLAARGTSLSASGSLAAGVVDGSGRLDVQDPAAALAALRRWWPQAPVLEIGGALAAECRVSGEPERPSLDATLDWQRPLLERTRTDALHAELRGPLDAAEWSLRLDVTRGAWLEASGVATLRGLPAFDALREGQARLEVADPAAVAATVHGWWPDLVLPEVGGGLLAADLRVSRPGVGSRIEGSLTWQRPRAAGVELEAIGVRFDGDEQRLAGEVRVGTLGDGGIELSGQVALADRRADGVWRAELPSLERATAGVEALAARGFPCGALSGEGTFGWSGATWQFGGLLVGDELWWQGWQADSLVLDLAADNERVSVANLSLDVAGGSVTGWLDAPLANVDGALDARLEWNGIDPSRLPLSLPSDLVSGVDGVLTVNGSPARPEGELRLEWRTPAGESRMLTAALEDGVLTAASSELGISTGPMTFDARLPLASLPRPAWMWPDAPAGPLVATLSARGLDSSGLPTALAPPVVARGDLSLDLSWDVADRSRRSLELRLDHLSLETSVERLEAREPVVLSLRDEVVTLAPVELAGEHSRVRVAASRYDMASSTVEASASLDLGPELAKAVPLPVPLTFREPLHVSFQVSGPLAALDGKLLVEHPGGRIILHDPPLQVADLHIEADVNRGVATITRGEATVNRGRMQIGGGWDPASGQGIVLELSDVNLLLPMGVVSRWDGLLTIEPVEDAIAKVGGELVLEGGLWDSPVDYAEAVFGQGSAPVAPDDPLHRILLDLVIRGRGGLAVDNNLGTFKVNWDELHVGGTAAMPVLEGELHLAEGGELSLAGRRTRIARGVITFTGEPGAEPRLEIVPERSLLEGSGELDAATVARQGVAQTLGKALGLENRTLQPAEVAVETETETSHRFLIGQRLSRRIALFFSTDLADPQDRVTTLQLWHLPGLPGLALQGFTETAGQDGGALIERLRWGGTEKQAEGPTIQKVKLRGRWPVSKRALKKVVGLEAGQPYDPFLLFVAQVRLERELDARGYFEAVVEGAAEGDPQLPTLAFVCTPGSRQSVRFEGDRVAKALRREVVGLYQAPPLEEGALEMMRGTLERRLSAAGFPGAVVTAQRLGDEVVVTVSRGAKLKLEGPVVEGVPPELGQDIQVALAGPAQLDDLLHDLERAAPLVDRIAEQRGFPAARVSRVWSEPSGRRRAVVHLALELGSPAVVSAVRVSGEDPLGLVAERFAVAAGDRLDRQRFDTEAVTLRRAYRDAGFTEASARVAVEAEQGSWVVTLTLEPGPEREVQEVRFAGLRHLSERLLRHSFTLQPGDLLTTAELDRGVVDLAAFAPVDRVTAEVVPVAGDAARVDVDVVEKPRWTLGLGGRWGTDRGLEVLVDLRDDDLFHRGFGANLRGNWSSEQQSWALIGALPRIPGGRLSSTFTLGYEDEEVSANIKEQRAHLGLEGTWAFTRQTAARAYTRLRRTHTFEIVPDPDFPLDDTFDILTVGGVLVVDRLDDPFDPRSGQSLTADLGWSTEISAGQREYLRSLVTGTLVLEPRAGWTWLSTLRAGASDPLGGTLIREARFFGGGAGSLRGFEKDRVGPLDYEGDPFGGGALLILNEELRLPLWRNLRLALFADTGNVWDSWSAIDGQLAVGAGLGVRLASPLGPLWLDVAWPLDDPGGGGSGVQLYVGMGRTF